MVNYCFCYGCKEKDVKGGPFTFFDFPRDEQRAKLWLQKIKRDDFIPTRFSKVCSKHFTEDCFYRDKYGAVSLKSNAVPTVFDFPKLRKRGLRGRKYPARRSKQNGVKANSQDQAELERIQRKFVPILPAPRNSAKRVWYILVPVVPKPGDTRPDDDKAGDGTTAGGESNNERGEMQMGVATGEKSGQLLDGEARDSLVCRTVNLEEDCENSLVEEKPREDHDTSAFSTTKEDCEFTFVKHEPVEDVDELLLPATAEDCEFTFVKHEPVEDVDELQLPATAEDCEFTFVTHKPVEDVDELQLPATAEEREYVIVKQEPADDAMAFTCLAAEEECEYITVKEEPIEDLDESACSAAQEECEYITVKEEPIEDLDESTCSAAQEVCDNVTVKLEHEPQYEENLCERHSELECEYIQVKDEPLDAEDPSDSGATHWVPSCFW